MSSRYALYEIDKISRRFAPEAGVPKGVKPRYNIAPGSIVPVVVQRDGILMIERMIWGFVPAGAPDKNSIFRYKTFSARSEGIFDKPSWRSVIRTQRCLIPANGFFEWRNSPSGKQPFYIHPTDQPIFSFAGIYSSWTDPAGVIHGTCALITTATGAETEMIPSRLPVILDPADEADWLNPAVGDINSLYKIMRPYDPALLSIIPVGDEINSTKVDTSDLIARLPRLI